MPGYSLHSISCRCLCFSMILKPVRYSENRGYVGLRICVGLVSFRRFRAVILCFVMSKIHEMIFNVLTECLFKVINRLTPNDPYMGRTAPLTSKRIILYIYSTNIGTEYFKHAQYSPFFFSLQNAVSFIMLTCLVPVLFTFYIQNVLKLKK